MSWGQNIDGETPLENREGLRDRTIRTREQLSAAEARNNAITVAKYLAKKPTRSSAKFDYYWMLKLHKEMFGKVWSWAGTIRKKDLNLGSSWHLIGSDLAELSKDLEFWKAEPGGDVLNQAVLLHHRTVRIHPFLNGNGRWSRLLSNIWLKLNDRSLINWPADMNIATSPVRAEYIGALKAADNGDISPLLELHRRFC